MTDQTNTADEQIKTDDAPKVDAPKTDDTPKPEAPKVTITPEIQAIIDRTAAEARKEGRESALKKTGEDDRDQKLAEAAEKIAALEAKAHAAEKASILSEFKLTAEDLDEVAAGLTGDALRAKAQWLAKFMPKTDDAAAPAPKPSYKNVQEAVDKVKAQTGTLDPLAAKIAAAAAKRR